MRPSRDEWAMSLAKLTAKRATCLRREVGAVILNERGHVLATGYNGVAAGMPHCNERTGFNFIYANGIDKSKQLTGQSTGEEPVFGNACSGAHAASGTSLEGCQAVHAEQNALLQCRDVHAIDTIYVTASPCMTCLKLLLNTSCRRVVFAEEYPHTEAKDLWIKAGRIWEQLK